MSRVGNFKKISKKFLSFFQDKNASFIVNQKTIEFETETTFFEHLRPFFSQKDFNLLSGSLECE